IPEGVDDNEFSLSDMYDPRSCYTAEQKMAAVTAYVVTGNSKQASKAVQEALGLTISPNTIRWWKASASWWPMALRKAQREKNDEVDAAMTRVMHVGLGMIERILDRGEQVITKDGDIVFKEPSLRDL